MTYVKQHLRTSKKGRTSEVRAHNRTISSFVHKKPFSTMSGERKQSVRLLSGGSAFIDSPENQKVDMSILMERFSLFNKRKGVRVGDFVIESNRKISRATYIWRDENDKVIQVQTGGGIFGQYYLDKGFLSYSGSLDDGVNPKEYSLIDTGRKKEGHVWFFHRNIGMADHGRDAIIPFKVFKAVRIKKTGSVLK